MLLVAFPWIIKQRGSIRYLKYVVTLSRQKTSKSKPPTIKVLASSSNPIYSRNPTQPEIQNAKKSKTKSIIGKDDVSVGNNKDTKETLLDQTTLNKHFPEVKLNLKPVLNPDVTAAASEIDTKDSQEKAQLKLLNSLNPSDLDWHKQTVDIKLLPKHYKNLSKFRLTGLVVLSTLAGYGMAPGVFEPTALLCMVLGTGLTSAAANTVNQVMEVPYDSQMTRTKNRVLIRGHLTPLHASVFAASCAVIGLSTLYLGTNALTAALGLTNLLLYTAVYTPMKRLTIANTWVGSVVGAIPPLMGWAAASGTLSTGAVLMAAILYCWQFPHFNALSWNLRADYSRAGYRMTSVIDPGMCRRVALRHSVALLALCSSAPLLDLTTWTFAFDSFPLNCYLVYCAWQFHKNGDSQSSRKLFRLSLVYLPALMFLMLVGKKHSVKDSEKS